MPAIPDWFEVTLTGFDYPDEIPCPRSAPEAAIPLGQFYWAGSPGGTCVERYRLSGNKGQQHFILWAGGLDEESERWLFVPAAYGPQKSPEGERVSRLQAGLWLLEASWRDEHHRDGVPGVDGFAVLEAAELEEIVGRVWEGHISP